MFYTVVEVNGVSWFLVAVVRLKWGNRVVKFVLITVKSVAPL